MRSEPLPTDVVRTYWWESPIALALMGAIAIHLIIGTFGDAVVVFNPLRPDPPPPPKLELVDIEVPPVVQPPPPPVNQPVLDPVKPQPSVAPMKIATHTHSEPIAPPPEPPPPATQPEGGGPVVAMPDVAPGAKGIAVATGPVTTHVGRGGTGTGTGSGTGSGTEAPAPMSVATIKTRALPRSDYSYEESKDYPAEAKQLSVGGKIRVKLVVDAQGNVKSAVLLNRLGHGLDELALSRANRILFDPAKDTDDQPVASVVVWTFDMSPPK